MSTLFISYASDDQAVALEVCAQLEAQGVRCWIAPRDVAPGAQWDEAIVDAITSSGAFLLMLTTAANASPYVKNEVNHAFAASKPIFTFRVEDVQPSKSIGFYLARHHWTDGFAKPLDQTVPQLAAAVTALLGAAALGDVLPRTAVKARKRSSWRRPASLVAACAAGGLLVGAGMSYTRPVASQAVMRLQITPPAAMAVTINGIDRDIAITPDGSRVVYVGNNGTQLLVRTLEALEPLVLFTGNPRGPFVSPDGQWVGFVDLNTTLKKVAITGGPAITVTQLDGGQARGQAWAADNTIIYGTSLPTTGLLAVTADPGPAAGSGAAPSVLTRPDRSRGEADHSWPEVLPGGRAVLFTIRPLTGGDGAASIAVLDVRTGTQKVLLRGGTHAQYAPSGDLVYSAGGSLQAVAFDLERLEIRGTPVTVVARVMGTNLGAVDAVVSGNGTLAYLSGEGGATTQRTMVWVDRQAHESPVAAPPRTYVYPRVSPDGTRVAFFSADQESDIWVWDLARTTLGRLTVDPGLDLYPLWTPDRRHVLFSSDREGPRNIFRQAADGTGSPERLARSDAPQEVTGISPDGTRVIFTERTGATGADIVELQLAPRGEPRHLVQTPFAEQNGIISPDGRWLAYEANDSGPFEIYVRPYPDVNAGKWQVSTGGGTRPLWSPDGQELFFLSPAGALMRIGVARSGTWSVTIPSVLVQTAYFSAGGNPGRTYDIAPDGQRFLVIKQGAGAGGSNAAPSIVVVLNWAEELKRLVPVN